MALPTSSDGTVRFEFVALSFRLWRDIDLRNGLCRTMETLMWRGDAVCAWHRPSAL
jgi:hypothetical protein